MTNWDSVGPGRLARLVAPLATTAVLACGGAQTGPESPGERGDGSTSSGRGSPSHVPDLAPAEAPPGVVVRFRASRLPSLLDDVFEAASIPISWRDAFERDPESAGLMRILDTEGTIEGAVVLNPRTPTRPSAFWSIGVTGVDPVLRLLDERRIDVQEGPGGQHHFVFEQQPCAVGRAIVGSAARVVCSDEKDGLTRLLPYALRGLPGERLSDAAVHVEFSMAPIREQHGAEFKTYLRWMPAFARTLHQGNPTFDRAISDGALLVADEAAALIDEFDSLTGQLFVTDGDFRAVVTARLVGRGSHTVKALRELSQRQGLPPAIFDAIPSTATTAGYSHELSAESTKQWWSVLSDLAQGAAELEKCSPNFSRKLGSVVAGFGSTGQTQVLARGPLVTSVSDGSRVLHPAWSLTGTTRSRDEVVKLIDDLVWVLASPELDKLLPDESEVPAIQKSQARIPGVAGARVYSFKLSPSARTAARLLGADLPGEFDTSDVDAVLARQEGLFAIAEVGDFTWMSWGRNADEISEAFRALSAQNSQRLGDLGALDGVRSEPASSAAFTQVSGLLGAFASALPSAKLGSWDDLRKAIPHRGTVPATYFFRVEAGDATQAVWEFRLPTEFVQDLTMLGYVIELESRDDDKRTPIPEN